MKQEKTKRIVCKTNSVSAGGGGYVFEINAQTLFAILMLTHGRVPGYSNSEIKEIHQQTNVTGHHVDDFMIVLNDLTTNRQNIISFQVKRSIIIGDNRLFKSVIDAAYKDFCSPGFKADRDRLVLLCGAVSSKKIEAFHFVHDFSKTQPDANTFFEKLFSANFTSKEAKEIVSFIQKYLRTTSKDISQETVFNFLKCFCVWTVDLHHDDSFVRALLNSHVALAINNSIISPKIIWSMVYTEMAERNQYAGVTKADDFPDEVKNAFIEKKLEEMPKKFSAKTKKSRSQKTKSNSLQINKTLLKRIRKHKLFRDLFHALMIGGWNEKSEKDKSFIVSMVKKDYDSWKQDIIALHHEFPKIISFKNDEWTVLHRRNILPLLKEDFFEDDMVLFEEAAINALLEVNPEFDYPTNTRFFQGKRNEKNYSAKIRENVAETVAIVGNISKPQNYSYNLLQQKAQSIVYKVLNKADYKIWGSLNRNLGELAEAAPSVFLDAVEESFFNDKNTFQKLCDEEDTDNFITARNYTSGIISALERLAWSEEYFLRTAEILLKLSTCKTSQFNGESSLNALTEIMLPWHPQTFVPADRRKTIADILLQKNPEMAWKLLLSLLPKSHSSAMNTARPEFLECSSKDFAIKVTTDEFWEVSEYYLSLATKNASGKISRIITLADFVDGYKPSRFQHEFISLTRSETIVSLPDEERFPLWIKLTRLCAEHHTFASSNWALSDEMLKLLDLATKHLRPLNKALEYRPLFSRNFSDLFPHDTNNHDSYLETQKYITKKQEKAVRFFLKKGGVKGLISFAQEVENASLLGYTTASVCTKSETQQILNSYLNADNPKICSFVESFIGNKYREHGECWINAVLDINWSTKEKVTFLCTLIPITTHVLSICKEWLKEEEPLYWKSLPPLCAFDINKDCFYSVVDGLLRVGRPVIALEILGQQEYNTELLFDANRAKAALLADEEINDRVTKMTGYDYRKVILLVQNSDLLSDDDKAMIEWRYLALLCQPGIKDEKHTPKYLYKKMSLEPAFFCKILGYAYKTTKDTISADDNSNDKVQKEKRAKKALDLLWHWRIIPEHYSKDHVFCFNLFEDWFNKVVEMTTASGHLEVALSEIGEALFYSPPEPDNSLFINRGIAELLDKEEYKKLRGGYRCGCFNSRGAYWVDPTAAPELKLAKEYREKALSVDNAGYPRFAESLRSIAERYEAEARKILEDHAEE